MIRLIITFGLLAVAAAFGSLDQFQRCIDTHTHTIPNDYLVGVWHRVYKFTFMGLTYPISYCSNVTYTIPTNAEINEYKARYDHTGLPFTMDANSLHAENNKGSGTPSQVIGMYTGTAEARYFVLDPKSHMVINMEGFAVDVFERVDDNYVVYWPCAMRENEMWIMSRHRNVNDDDIKKIIEERPALRRLLAQKNCAGLH